MSDCLKIINDAAGRPLSDEEADYVITEARKLRAAKQANGVDIKTAATQAGEELGNAIRLRAVTERSQSIRRAINPAYEAPPLTTGESLEGMTAPVIQRYLDVEGRVGFTPGGVFQGSTLPEVREIGERLYGTSHALNKHYEGITSEPDLNFAIKNDLEVAIGQHKNVMKEQLKQFKLEFAELMKTDADGIFAELNRGRGIKTITRDEFDKNPGKYAKEGWFRELNAKAKSRGDASLFASVRKVLKQERETEASMWSRAYKVGLVHTPDVPARMSSGDSFGHRVPNKSAILEHGTEFIKRHTDDIKAKNPTLSDAEAHDMATGVYGQYLKLERSELEGIARGKSLAERKNTISDAQLEDFLLNDNVVKFDEWLEHFARKVNAAEKGVDLEPALGRNATAKQLNDIFDARRAELVAAGDNQALARLAKEQNRVMGAFETLINSLNGTTANKKGDMITRGMQDLRKLAAVTGLSVLTNLVDASAIVMAHGLIKPMKSWMRVIGKSTERMSADDAKYIGSRLERIMMTRYDAVADLAKAQTGSSRNILQRGIDWDQRSFR